MNLMNAMSISGAGMAAQSTRMKIASENIANADSVIGDEAGNPYRRQQVFLKEVQNADGSVGVAVDNVSPDRKTPFRTKYDPSNPLADQHGMVKMPNVDPILEQADLRDAARSYEANMSAIGITKNMFQRSLDLLK